MTYRLYSICLIEYELDADIQNVQHIEPYLFPWGVSPSALKKKKKKKTQKKKKTKHIPKLDTKNNLAG